MFEKNLAVAELLDSYAAVISERHRQLLDLYYNEDLSLGEIAAEVGISRQGVRDGIKKAEEELFFFEERLHLAKRARAVEKTGAALLTLTADDRDLHAAALALLAAAGISDENEGGA